MAFSDNCHGSERCDKDMGDVCREAFARFTDDSTYNAYTSRTNGNCVAIYRCDGGYLSLTGAQLKTQFEPIFGGQGCKGCGSHAFNDGSCETTLNFCSNCFDSGIPN